MAKSLPRTYAPGACLFHATSWRPPRFTFERVVCFVPNSLP